MTKLKGSIYSKKDTSLSFCKEGVMVNGEGQLLKTDLIILATGFRGDEKLKDIFVFPTFQDHIDKSPNTTVPLYRLVHFFYGVGVRTLEFNNNQIIK